MKPILIKKYLKSEYIFYPDSVQKRKKGIIINEFNLADIEEITYNIKFGFNDFIKIVIDRLQPYFYFRKSFVIILNSKPHLISIKLEKEEYLLLKNRFQKFIELI